jgi:tetratricopeptide (TPR) repeat protein
MKVNGGTCPSLETVGAFVDGRLMDRERETIADHLASCETCYFVFSEAARTRTTAQTKGEVVPFPPRRVTWKTVAAGLAAAAVLLLAVNVWYPFGVNGDERALATLVAAAGTTRTTESRLTGGFAYAPVRGPVRGATDVELSPDTRIAIAEIEKQYAAKPVAATAALISGDTNHAIDILEAHSQLRPNDPKILSDLAAAYLARAVRASSTDDVARALKAANGALEIDRLMPEALFNRALALQMSGVTDEARIAWQAYLAVDDRSGWADEARARLRILSNQP